MKNTPNINIIFTITLIFFLAYYIKFRFFKRPKKTKKKKDPSYFQLDVSDLDKVKFIDYEKILETYNLSDIAIIKLAFEKSKICYYFLGENFNDWRPWVQPVKLMIKKSQTKKAKSIINDLKLRYSPFSASEKISKWRNISWGMFRIIIWAGIAISIFFVLSVILKMLSIR